MFEGWQGWAFAPGTLGPFWAPATVRCVARKTRRNPATGDIVSSISSHQADFLRERQFSVPGACDGALRCKNKTNAAPHKKNVMFLLQLSPSHRADFLQRRRRRPADSQLDKIFPLPLPASARSQTPPFSVLYAVDNHGRPLDRLCGQPQLRHSRLRACHLHGGSGRLRGRCRPQDAPRRQLHGLGAINDSIAGTILAISIEHPGPPFVETSLRFCVPSIRVVPGS